MDSNITPFSPAVLNTLENILHPGKRARLSPYIEAAQISKLFGETLDLSNRNGSLNKITGDNIHKIQKLAERWYLDFSKRSLFSKENYKDQEYLDLYLLYYFSSNVAKIQMLLLDMLRQRLIGSDILIADLGVGTGTTAVALFDFLFAWNTVCDLFGTKFPVNNVHYQGIDFQQETLNYARDVVSTYGNAIADRLKFRKNQFSQDLLSWIRSTSWSVQDILSDQTVLGEETNFVVISNVLNELSDFGKSQLAIKLNNLNHHSLVLIVEPGDASNSKTLMNWRRENFDPFSWEMGPCGTGLNQLPSSCNDCWNSRKFSFHEPLYYRKFREILHEEFLEDKRGFNEFNNNLLSFSNAWLYKKHRNSTKIDNPFKIEYEPKTLRLQYVGTYIKKTGYEGPSDDDPDGLFDEDIDSWKEFVKLCPGNSGAPKVFIRRETGYQLPILHQGDFVLIEDANITKRENSWLISLSYESQLIPEKHIFNGDVFIPDNNEINFAIDEFGFRLFGFNKMYEFQHKIISRVLSGKSILGIAATGSGKSECFILPAMALPGVTIVISPLISLMTDQYEQRISERYGLGRVATFINSSISFGERNARLRRMELGYYKIVYFTPEQLEREFILESLRRTNQKVGVRYLAMDEAHCISQWGHDFRPSYLNMIQRLREYKINPVRIALTATASPYVRKDICEELQFVPELLEKGGDVYIESSNRPELNLIVRVHESVEEKANVIIDELRKFRFENMDDELPSSAIVFMPHTGGNPDKAVITKGRELSSRVNDFASYLEKDLGVRVSIYHSDLRNQQLKNARGNSERIPLGNLKQRNRREEQKLFIEGKNSIMVATKGFGMGIDKDNVRLIIHRTPPANLEAYAQEAGRAGRDGQEANVILHYSPDNFKNEEVIVKSDYEIQSYFLSEKYVREVDVKIMIAFLKQLPKTNLGTYYFTNDQVIEFFDSREQDASSEYLSLSYSWPNFPARKVYKAESKEHKKILDIGHIYKSKTNYINKILQVLYRVRPTVDNKVRVPFLNSLNEVGIEIINPKVLNVSGILNSNAYFGELFRSLLNSEEELINLLLNSNMLEIANELNKTLVETKNLLNDIKFADGNFRNDKYWDPALYNFSSIISPKLGTAANKTLDEWRNYAGASKRAFKTEAQGNAKKAGRGTSINSKGKKYPKTTLDDWFSEKELNKPKGWEVSVGEAFYNEGQLHEYISAFIELNNEREQNDWASYHRLLADYIGVHENGKLKISHSGSNCLRSVLLGYLETYEVVTGNNCFSCSNCVKDGNFGLYSIEQKKAAVVKILPLIADYLEQFKLLQNQLPLEREIEEFFELLKQEELKGRAVIRYFIGWSAKLLDSIPQHTTAMYLRIYSAWKGFIDFEQREVINFHKSFLKNPEILERLPIITIPAPEFLDSTKEWKLLLVEIFEKLNKKSRLLPIIDDLLEIFVIEKPINHSAIYTLCKKKEALLKELGEEIPVDLTLWLARTAEDELAAENYYKKIVNQWNLSNYEDELIEQAIYNCGSLHQAAIFCAMPGTMFEERKQDIAILIAENRLDVTKWKSETLSCLIEYFPIEYLTLFPTLANQALLEICDDAKILHIALVIHSHGFPIGDEQKDIIVDSFLKLGKGSTIYSLLASQKPKELYKLMFWLTTKVDMPSWSTFVQWTSFFNDPLSQDLRIIILKRGLRFCKIRESQIEARKFMRTIFIQALKQNTNSNELLKVYDDIWANDPHEMMIILDHFSNDDSIGERLSIQLLSYLLEKPTLDYRIFTKLHHENIKFERWKNIAFFSKKLESFLIEYPIKSASDIDGNWLYNYYRWFKWHNDQLEAYMLSQSLEYLLTKLNPNWKTPISKYVQILIAAGCIDEAKKISEAHNDIKIQTKSGEIITASAYVMSQNVGKKLDISHTDFKLVSEKIFKLK